MAANVAANGRPMGGQWAANVNAPSGGPAHVFCSRRIASWQARHKAQPNMLTQSLWMCPPLRSTTSQARGFMLANIFRTTAAGKVSAVRRVLCGMRARVCVSWRMCCVSCVVCSAVSCRAVMLLLDLVVVVVVVVVVAAAVVVAVLSCCRAVLGPNSRFRLGINKRPSVRARTTGPAPPAAPRCSMLEKRASQQPTKKGVYLSRAFGTPGLLLQL